MKPRGRTTGNERGRRARHLAVTACLAALAGCDPGTDPGTPDASIEAAQVQAETQEVVAVEAIEEAETQAQEAVEVEAVDAPGHFRFAVISDTHIIDQYYVGPESNPLDSWSVFQTTDRLKAARAALSALNPPPDFVLVGGDVVHNYPSNDPAFYDTHQTRFDAAAELFAGFPFPVHLAWGNHDYDEPDVPRSLSHHLFDTRFHTAPYHAFDHQGWTFLLLDAMLGPTQNPGNPEEDGTFGSLGAEQLDWLEQQLARGRPTVIVVHFPLALMAENEGGRPGLPSVVKAHAATVRQVFSGHLHRWLVNDAWGVPELTVSSTRYEPNAYVVAETGSSGAVNLLNQDCWSWMGFQAKAWNDHDGCVEAPPTPPVTISFVHVNDLHGSYTLGPDGTSPWASAVTYWRQSLAANPNTLFTDAGDDHEKGSVAEQLSQGLSTAEAVLAMPFDVRTVGNHDLAWNHDEILKFTKDPHATVLCSNQVYTGPNPEGWGAVPYAEKTVGGVKIGFFGMTPWPYDETNGSFEGDYYPWLKADYDYPKIAGQIVSAHRSGVDLLVMVSHLGKGDDVALAEEVPGIDVILGGHSHDVISPAIVGSHGTLIIQSGSSATVIGRIDVDVDPTTRAVVGHREDLSFLLPIMVPADPDTEAAIEAILNKYAPDAGKAVGQVAAGRDDAFIATLAARFTREALGADAAIINPDTVWTGWGPGPLTLQQTVDTFKVERQPPGTSGFSAVMRAQLGGADLARVLAARPTWGYDGPAEPDPAVTYTVAMQKGPALKPASYDPPDVVPVPLDADATELWSLLRDWAVARTAACLYVDEDLPIPGC